MVSVENCTGAAQSKVKVKKRSYLVCFRSKIGHSNEASNVRAATNAHPMLFTTIVCEIIGIRKGQAWGV